VKLTGGQAGGLRVDTPPGKHTRPSTDRLRESLFAVLTPRLPDARVLDLYAGSGSLGLEAASRGARVVQFVERHAPTLQVLQSNIARMGPAGVTCEMQGIRRDALAFVAGACLEPYDLILVDPPYAEVERAQWFPGLLDNLRNGNWLTPSGLLTLECDARTALPESVPGWSCGRRKAYGTSAVTFWQQDEAD
jgi:16S rRNA (guanine966-N2)-methyltransferase